MRRDFSNVIEQRNAKDASESDRVRGQQRAEELQVHTMLSQQQHTTSTINAAETHHFNNQYS
jgi:hypothetical protein